MRRSWWRVFAPCAAAALEHEFFKRSQCPCHLSFLQGSKWCTGRRPTASYAILMAPERLPQLAGSVIETMPEESGA